MRLQLLGVAMVTGVAGVAVIERHFQAVDAGLVGLAVSYALSVNALISGVVSSFTETEMEMVSVERAQQYIVNVPHELVGGDATLIDAAWPREGRITFQHATLVYRAGIAPSLVSVTFDVAAGERLGIVGRTGAGKSSLFVALFRLTELAAGAIYVDGTDISLLPLATLRSRMSMIPQDAVLFEGTVRDNVDPFDEYTDDEVLAALHRCGLLARLADATAADGVGAGAILQARIAERGANTSVGERQLLCLARALLRRTQILCIDEATANVDQQTDALMQRTLRDAFRGCTILTIAHRISTVVDCDRIVVMSEGRIAESGTPADLLARPTSMFAQLVRRSGGSPTPDDWTDR